MRSAHTLISNPDTPSDRLKNCTPRQVFIQYSRLYRERHGETAIVDEWVRNHKTHKGYSFLLVTDVRFQHEVGRIAHAFGDANVMCVRVKRDDHGWDGDVGMYCDHALSIDLHNTPLDQEPDGENAGTRLLRIAHPWLR